MRLKHFLTRCRTDNRGGRLYSVGLAAPLSVLLVCECHSPRSERQIVLRASELVRADRAPDRHLIVRPRLYRMEAAKDRYRL